MTPEEIRQSARKRSKKEHLAQLLEHEQELVRQYAEVARNDFMYFVRGLTIDGQTGPRIFEDVMAEYQRECFETIAASLHSLRDGFMPEVNRAWFERTKKASKDADLAIIVAWLVAFPQRPFYGQIGAADRSQASIVRDRLTAILHHNPWLNEHIAMVGNVIRSKRLSANGRDPLCRFDIMSADVAGAHGGTPDLLILNELSHIKNMEFAYNLLDNADGVAQGMVLIATNAGIKGSESWKLRSASAKSGWAMFILDRPAPWHSAKTIEEARKRNTPSRFKRLWKGIWVLGSGDAVDHADIEAMFKMKRPQLTPEKDYIYLLGLDLGVSQDHAGLAVVGINEKLRKVKVVNWRRWKPEEGIVIEGKKKVNLKDVREWCKIWSKLYRAEALVYDPHQAALLVQDLVEENITTREMTFSSSVNLAKMASSFVQLVTSHQIEAYDDEHKTLSGDFAKFNIVEKSYGMRLEATSDASGHADVGTAVVVTLPAAVDFLDGRGLIWDGEEELAEDETEDLTEEEISELPDEFKELFDDDELEPAYHWDDEDDPLARFE